MPKLWQKDYSLDVLMEQFTVGNDYMIDQELVICDCLASIAHAFGLAKIGLLTDEEFSSLKQGLTEIICLRQQNDFPITRSDEDCHTAIENYLTRKLGETGKKIHSGRSRNDQVQVALRLWMRDYCMHLCYRTSKLAETLLVFAKKYEFVPMPGRTHMQIAMPSSVGLWAASFAEELLDEAALLSELEKLLNQSPLGAAASYGVPIPLQRTLTSQMLGFSKVQNNVLYAIDSRGKFEAMLLDHCDYIALTISKLAQDLILFTLPEFGYFSLPKELCTGSSIMPQKKNPDGLELARSRAAVVSSDASMVKAIIRSLPSGYNRDFQDTKPPLFEGTRITWMLASIMSKIVDGLMVHEDKLVAACTAPLYATDAVFDKVNEGISFRDAYKDVGLHLEKVTVPSDILSVLKKRTSEGSAGNLGLDRDMAWAESLVTLSEDFGARIEDTYQRLSGLMNVHTVLY